MATNIEDLAKQFQGFQSMMKKALDELSSFNSWKGAVDEWLARQLLRILFCSSIDYFVDAFQRINSIFLL